MVFIRGHRGYWKGKKRPSLLKTNSVKTMFKKGEHYNIVTEFREGQKPWNTNTKGLVKPNKGSFKIGLIPWNKGIKTGLIPANYKGELAGYGSKHSWIYRHKGKASRCIFCGVKNKRYTWANISGKYKRDFNDYMELCYSCHKFYDQERRNQI